MKFIPVECHQLIIFPVECHQLNNFFAEECHQINQKFFSRRMSPIQLISYPHINYNLNESITGRQRVTVTTSKDSTGHKINIKPAQLK